MKTNILKKLEKLRIEFASDYDQAGLESDGEIGVHNDYEQGKKDAIDLIIEIVKNTPALHRY